MPYPEREYLWGNRIGSAIRLNPCRTTGHMTRFAAMLVDLDGTLMVTDTISQRVKQAIETVSRHIPVSIATGRRASDLITYARQLGLSAPQICNGGATLLDPADGKLLWNSHMAEKQARRIIELLDEKGINFIGTHPSGDSTSMSQVSQWGLTRISAMDIPEKEADDFVSMFGREDNLNVVKVYLHYNGWWAVDFTAAGVHKGEAARQLAQIQGIDTRQFIAAGDSYNDLPMLEAAGFRIAMASAPQEMKAIADFVAPSVEEDGLAVAIEQAVLPLLAAD